MENQRIWNNISYGADQDSKIQRALTIRVFWPDKKITHDTSFYIIDLSYLQIWTINISIWFCFLNTPSFPCWAKDKNISRCFIFEVKNKTEISILQARDLNNFHCLQSLYFWILFFFLKMQQQPWLWDTVRLSVFLSPPGDGRLDFYGWKIILFHEKSYLPHSFFKLI